MSETSLYGLASELVIIENITNEEPELDQEALAIRMNAIVSAISEKTDAVCGYNQSIDDYLDAIDERISELQELKKKTISKQNNFHKYILAAIDQLGVKKITGNLYSISYRAPVQSVEIVNENEIPSRYIKIKEIIEIDKKQIREDLKEGQIVEGAQLKTGARNLTFKAGGK